MPVYEYECSHCGESFEIRQGFDSEPVLRCPNCDRRAKRRPSRFSFTFADMRKSKVVPGARQVRV